jgi:hypothetical protein
VAGYFADANGMYHGFIEQGGAYTTIDVSVATETYPDGINNKGTLQGQWDNADYTAQGFSVTGAEMTAIVGINDREDICGGYWTVSSGRVSAFIRDPAVNIQENNMHTTEVKQMSAQAGFAPAGKFTRLCRSLAKQNWRC